MRPSNDILNSVLITMARSFLQYVAESFPWVSREDQSVGEQVEVIALRQRQDVGELAELLTSREYFVDFGTFPTEYTDMQFLALGAMFEGLHASQSAVTAAVSDAISELQSSGDEQGLSLLQAIEVRQKEAAHALKEIGRDVTCNGTV